MKEQEMEQAISDFTVLMYQKGYRGRFTLDTIAPHRTFFSGGLGAGLLQYFSQQNGQSRFAGFRMTTSPPNIPTITCRLDVEFDPVKGFLAKRMIIYHHPSNENRIYRLQNNHQIPGTASITGLFPKRKPWDDFLRGKKFRP